MSAITDISSNLQGQMLLHTVQAVKGDTDRVLRISLSNGGTPYEISQDAYAVLMGRKPDGTAVYNNCRIENNRILYEFTDQTCAVEGSFSVQIRLYGPDQMILTTVPIQIDVYPTAFDAEAAAASADEQTALDDLVNRTRALQLEILHDRDTGAYQGESAYEIAQRLGFQGSEAEWIDSLRYDHSEEFSALAVQVRQAVETSAGHVTAAEKARNQAAGSAETAAAQAGEASHQAGLAREQAAAAGNHAAAASESAQQAETHAQTASGAAETAATQAQTAGKEADRAKTEADKAAQAALDAQTILDDSVISQQKTRSSLKLYDTLCPAFEKTGSVVTCHPVADYPLHVVSKIDVWQEGEGEPSPSNVRPIKSVSKVELNRCGENLLPPEYVSRDRYGIYIGFSGKKLFKCFKNIKYTLRVSKKMRSITVTSEKGLTLKTAVSTDVITLTLGVDTHIKVSLLAENTPLLEPFEGSLAIYASIDPKECVPYIGETYTTDLPTDTASVTVDWEKKKSTVAGKLVKASSLKWYFVQKSGHSFCDVPGKKIGYQTSICDKLKNVDGAFDKPFGDGIYSDHPSLSRFYIPIPPGVTTEDQWKQWLADNDITFAYQLAEVEVVPAAISEPITALPGTNTLYSSTGDTAVSGRAAPNIYWQKKIDDLTKVIVELP